MLIPPRGGRDQGMALCVMQQRQGPTAQNRSQPPDQAARDHLVGVDRFAMSINVKRDRSLRGILDRGGPQASCPGSERLGQPVGAIDLREVSEKPLRMNVAIGPLPLGEQRQQISRVAT